MELTLESAFSTGGLLGHSSYLLLVLSMVSRSMVLLRILVIGSALIAIAYDVFWLKDPVGLFWETALVTVNLVQLSITWLSNRRVRFSAEEKIFLDDKLAGLGASDSRRLLDCGEWVSAGPGLELTREGEPVPHLVYLADGEVTITSGGKRVAVCGPGSYIGEMTALNAEPATGSAHLAAQSRFWRIAAADLRRHVERRPETGQALEAGFARSYRDKLVRSNRFIVEQGADAPVKAARRARR